MWITKIYFLRKLKLYLSYDLAEEVITSINDAVSNNDPNLNPLYHTSNLILVTLLIYELSHKLEEAYPFLITVTEEL